MRRVAAGLAVLTLGGSGPRTCASEPGASDFGWIGQVGPERIEGRVRVVGSQPFSRPVIEPEGERGVAVTGPYAAEVARLAGAVIRLTGRAATADIPGPAFEATSYEILSVDGDRPYLGTLRIDADGVALVSGRGAVARLEFVPEALRNRAGALVWIVLDETGSVARYGILREPA